MQKIKQFNFSIGIFAPAWTFERIQDIGLNPFEANGSDVCNAHFIRRNNQFWSLLWKHLYCSGPKTLPFYTSFCLGSGKRKFRDGVAMGNSPWFNLLEQEFQPSVPLELIHHFDEAYRGGSCFKFSANAGKLRLFVSEFDCDRNIIVSYVFKRSTPHIHVQFILNVLNEDRQCLQITCGDVVHYDGEKRFKTKHYYPLRGNNLQTVIIGLSNRQEKLFPSFQPVNGWEARYFNLRFGAADNKFRIVDLGISIENRHWALGDELLLGAVHIHEGIDDDVKSLDVVSNLLICIHLCV